MPPQAVYNPSVVVEHHNQVILEEPNEKCNVKATYNVDDFRPLKTLGYGDMGTVFLAILRSTNESFAMKVMKKDVISARKNWQRVNTEREILSKLDHPFLPSLFTHFESDKYIYLVTKYCSGGDLNILRQKQPEKDFSEAAIKFYAAEVLSALEHLHKHGFIYRDLKPENILIQEDGHIILTDFDLSLIVANRPVIKIIEKRSKKPGYFASLLSCSGGRFSPKHDSGKNSASKVFPLEYNNRRKPKNSAADIRSLSFVGTEEYVAPEVVWGTGHGHPVDWWTFGVLLYELFYGRTPFRGSNRKETFYRILSKDPELPGPWSPLKDLISRLLIKEPENRLGSNRGADEIKDHMFFQGVQWHNLHLVSRPPVVPSPFSLEDFVKDDKQFVIDDHIRQKSSIKKDESTEQTKSTSLDVKASSARPPAGMHQSLPSSKSMENLDTFVERQSIEKEDIIENSGSSLRTKVSTSASSVISLNDRQCEDKSSIIRVDSASCCLSTSGQANSSGSVSIDCKESFHCSEDVCEASHNISSECTVGDSEHGFTKNSSPSDVSTDEEAMKLDPTSRLSLDKSFLTADLVLEDVIPEGKRVVLDSSLAEREEELLFEHF